MERILNDDDKLRRAEEIYYRRNNKITNLEHNVKIKKNNFALNFLIMLNLAIIVFCVQNSKFVFSEKFLDIVNQYNLDIGNKVKEFFDGIIFNEDSIKNMTTENVTETNENLNKITENNNNINDTNVEDVKVEQTETLTSTLDEMEEDVKNLKVAYSFINPLNGVVSSVFGARESKYQNVNGYHTGVDIAADMGKEIIASMEGIVELVSSEGNYGKHIKIRCNNVTTLYAHCSKIYVKEGQIVAKGEKIAAVGNTGNSTGPHLHFEIRVEDRFVDPAKVIEFN